jgi:cytosine/adenosine deaminase-related metal-dependent hydrolase
MIANRLFAESRGSLAPGRLADIVIIDYLPPTPLQAETLYGHLLFGISFARVMTTIARGRVIFDAGQLVGIDEAVPSECRRFGKECCRDGRVAELPRAGNGRRGHRLAAEI